MIAKNAVLSMWLTYLKSLKTNHDLNEPILACAPQASMVITGIHQHLYNSIILQNPIDNLRLIEELHTVQQHLDLPLTVWLSSDKNVADYEGILKKTSIRRDHFMA